MEVLRNLFKEAGVPDEQITEVIQAMGVTSVDELKYFTDPESFAKAGVSNMLAQRKLAEKAQEIKTAQEAQLAAESEAENTPEEGADLSLLAEKVSEEEWVEMIRQDGLLKFDRATYIGGIKAVLATNLGVFDAVEKLTRLVNEYAINNAMPVPKFFYTLQTILTRREYGLIFAASENNRINGVPIYATKEDVDQLIQKIRGDLVPNILKAADTVVKWHTDLAEQKATDFFVEQTIHGEHTNQYGAMPSPAMIYDAGLDLRNSINRTFAGNGIQKALAIYNEYKEFIEVINDDGLPVSVGAVDRDAVLQKLGFDANAAAVRSEVYIVQFVMSLIDVERLASVDELQFFRALYNLTLQIDWSALTADPQDRFRFGRSSGIGYLGIGIGRQNQEYLEARDQSRVYTMDRTAIEAK